MRLPIVCLLQLDQDLCEVRFEVGNLLHKFLPREIQEVRDYRQTALELGHHAEIVDFCHTVGFQVQRCRLEHVEQLVNFGAREIDGFLSRKTVVSIVLCAEPRRLVLVRQLVDFEDAWRR